MTWASIISSGSGKIVGFRLAIEGWPEQWVSNTRITFATPADGRAVRMGLISEGLGFSERLSLQEARTIPRGFTAKIRSTDLNDRATASFSTRATQVAYLSSTIASDATSLTASASLTSGTYYHIGTEVIKATSTGASPTIERQKWDTHAQSHPAGVASVFGDTFSSPIYDRPTTMEGRRANLFVYGEGDTLTGQGTIVFRGVVSRPPRLESDGVTWAIQIEPITSLLNQHIANRGAPARIHGIYHHRTCPVFLNIRYGAVTNYVVTTIVGIHTNLQDLIEEINNEIATALTTLSATNISSCVVVQSTDLRSLLVRIRTGAGAPDFSVIIGSPLIGYAHDGAGWGSPHPLNPDNMMAGRTAWDSLAAAENYMLRFEPSVPGGGAGSFIESISNQMACLGDPLVNQYVDPADTANPWRLYFDTDLTPYISVGEFIYLDGLTGLDVQVSAGGPAGRSFLHPTESGSRILEVSAIATSSGLCVVDFIPSVANGFPDGAFCGPQTTAVGIRDYGEGHVGDFRDAICSEGVDANYGDTPFIAAEGTDPLGDMAAWVPGDIIGTDPALSNRVFRFTRSKSIGEIIREELKLIAHYLYLDAEFRMAIRPFPNITQVHVSTISLDSDFIITPDGKHGMWPGWEPQRDGLVNEVDIHGQYDPVTDEWLGRVFTVRDLGSIIDHKTRGKGRMEIKPFSSSQGQIFPSTAKLIADNIFSVLAKDYVQVTVDVPFTMFSVCVGDVVLFTNAQVPDGDGGRGVTNRRAFVFERQWSFDPPRAGGKLVLCIPLYDVAGYTPSAYITGQSNTAGNTWVITADGANAKNIAWSQDGDGDVLDHFQAGDKVEVIQYGDSGETRVAGTVDSVAQASDQITVTFDATWTPGGNTWLLEWPKDTGSTTARQQTYAYVADSGTLLVNGDIARRFS